MPSFALVFVGITITTIPVTLVASRATNSDLSHLLKQLQSAQHSNDQLLMKTRNSDESLELFKKLSNLVQSEVNHEHNKYTYEDSLNKNYANTRLENVKKRPSLEDYFASLLAKKVSNSNKINHHHSSLDNSKNDYKLDVNDYSKIYVVLDPKANLEYKDVPQISNLVSELLSNWGEKERRYKGFRLANTFKSRRNRDRDPYEREDEHDYKPKRPRKEFGAGGRTAIPYIRHQGGLFEKGDD